ncbi:large-conductance mechanosensitive channel protein MscL [uncultured Thiothrix sp.]|uniref:large-conductance mechanosensitive channel protein MscL n=1 Tax=uncultured Thiothrix sp. TaxID=223185 RepID=UPI0026257640|nr:large-conductance mechanosensitive channel protein MscL [uncultured Thiothrix sp.]HMT94266.1 large-conductance mechanosensitive channel protein MscL [Thiolinea sp.]
MSLISEFKAFVMRGNVVDLAVGVIIGAAFGKIVASLVNDILMPPIGMLLGGVNFSDLSIALDEAGKVVIKYGAFIQTIVDFLIIAAAIFVLVKVVNKVQKPKEAPPSGPTQEELLIQIRDILKSK